MRRQLLIAALPLVLGGCVGPAEYAYCYDPYQGPRGYYVGALDPQPSCANPTNPSAAVAFRGPYADGFRGPYMAGPYAPPARRPIASPAAAPADGS
jgi:hypothetical protein